MVAAQAESDYAGSCDLGEGRGRPLEGVGGRAGDRGHVSVVDERQSPADVDVQYGVVVAQHDRGAANRLRPEARTAAKDLGAVAGDSDHGDVDLLEVLDVRKAHERPRAREPRRLEGVRRSVARHLRGDYREVPVPTPSFWATSPARQSASAVRARSTLSGCSAAIQRSPSASRLRTSARRSAAGAPSRRRASIRSSRSSTCLASSMPPS